VKLHLTPSLFRHLLAWTLGCLLAVWATFVYFAYQTGVHEADEVTDGHLASVASLLLSQRVTSFARAPDPATLGGSSDLRAHDYQQSLSVFIWDRDGNLLARTGEAPTPPYSENEGFETLAIGSPPVRWRSFSRWDGSSRGRRISVMLSLDERDGLAEDIAEQVVTPGLWLLPAISLLLFFAIRRGLRPLNDLGRQVHVLDIHRDTALHGPPHEEFRAIVKSITNLIQRYNLALARERQLASEVAHELRTPIASIVLNASTLESQLSEADRLVAARRVKQDAARAGAVIADLLALARASRTELAEAAQPVELVELARSVVAEYAERSYQAGQELSLEAPQECVINGHPVLLQIALRNLIENAMQHTPAGSQIEVIVGTNPPTLEVQDNGPAMPAHALRRGGAVGLGLGLQVVSKIAEIHQGYLETPEGSEPGHQRYRVVLGDVAALTLDSSPAPARL
jgi:two-component system, OmpR family, sensor histidine kinase QseC